MIPAAIPFLVKLAPFAKGVWAVLKTTIPIPIGIIAAAVLFWYVGGWWDKTQAIKEAVQEKVAELVSAAELERLKAENERLETNLRTQTLLAREREQRAKAWEEAYNNFQESAAQTEAEKAALEKRIEDIRNDPSIENLCGAGDTDFIDGLFDNN